MLSFELNDRRHRGNRIFVDDTGKIWYGASEDDLKDPEGLEFATKFPPFYSADIQEAINTGMELMLNRLKGVLVETLEGKELSAMEIAARLDMPLTEVLRIMRQ